MINAEVLQGQWNEIKGVLKSHWGALTADDLRRFNGDVDQLVGVIQRKTGESREAVQAYLEEVAGNASSMIASAAETVREVTNRTAASMNDTYENVSDHMRERYADVEDMVRTRPAESVAVAFGAGLLAGVIVGLVLRNR